MVRAKVIIRALSLAAMIAGGASAALVAPRWWPALHAAETWLQDFQVALLTPSRPRDERIVVLTITEDTLARVARTDPLDRAFLADRFLRLVS